MKLSKARQSELYDTIASPIMDLRLQYIKGAPLTAEELDAQLCRLETQIWHRVHKALNLEGPA